MFWKREEKKAVGGLVMLDMPPMPPKKQFATMLEMLRDAEKYDSKGEKDVSIAMLTNLCEFIERYKTSDNPQKGDDFTADVGHSMTGDGMNCLEFFDMIKKEWCLSEEQCTPFWNDVLTFARKYHKERKEYCCNK